MKLTPLDIHHKEFRVALRGYNQEEVDAFLDEVADEFERLFKENIDLSEKYEAAAEKVRGYAEMEKTLHNTMLAAQQSAEEIRGKATKESELLLRDAEMKAKELVQAALAQKQKTQSEFMRIKQVEDEFRMAFRSLLEDHMRALHAIPVAEDVAEMVGIAQETPDPGVAAMAPEPPVSEVLQPPAPEVAQPPADETLQAPAPEVPVSSDPQQGEVATPAMPSFAEALASATESPTTDADEGSPRPRAQAGRLAPEPDAPVEPDEPSGSGVVQSVQLGELSSPDLGPDLPTYDEPVEFRPGGFGVVGEREEDMDIEEID